MKKYKAYFIKPHLRKYGEKWDNKLCLRIERIPKKSFDDILILEFNFGNQNVPTRNLCRMAKALEEFLESDKVL